jgi:hypothetical protein
MTRTILTTDECDEGAAFVAGAEATAVETTGAGLSTVAGAGVISVGADC